MLTDPVEIEIASRALQPGIRDPARSRVPFEHFFADFMDGVSLEGVELLDLGPGQWDFGVLAMERGAKRVVGIDNDEAVVELGRHKGFEAVLGNIRSMDPAELGTFDGVFNRGSFNAFWGATLADQAAYVDGVAAMLEPDGWGWVAPWNGAPAGLTDEDRAARLAAQADAFRRHGFQGYDVSDKEAAKYCSGGAVANNAIFVRGLKIPPAVAQAPRL